MEWDKFVLEVVSTTVGLRSFVVRWVAYSIILMVVGTILSIFTPVAQVIVFVGIVMWFLALLPALIYLFIFFFKRMIEKKVVEFEEHDKKVAKIKEEIAEQQKKPKSTERIIYR